MIQPPEHENLERFTAALLEHEDVEHAKVRWDQAANTSCEFGDYLVEFDIKEGQSKHTHYSLMGDRGVTWEPSKRHDTECFGYVDIDHDPEAAAEQAVGFAKAEKPVTHNH